MDWFPGWQPVFGADDPAWKADLARIGRPRAWLKEQSLWAIWVYRFGRRVDRRRPGLFKSMLLFAYWFLFRVVETVTGISLPKSCIIGKGLRIWHFGGIFINPDTVIGENCTLRQGVTVGNRHEDGGSPTLGDEVDLGAYAQILGEVRVGHRCRIGAMAVVLTNIPDGTTAVGQPARVVPFKPVSIVYRGTESGIDIQV
jgi:serine O-acetyltransferase